MEGHISQQADKSSGMVLLADKRVVKVASLIKAGDADIIRSKWVMDCLANTGGKAAYLLPFEEGHLFHATEEMQAQAKKNVDVYGDSFARDVDVDELRDIFSRMSKEEEEGQLSHPHRPRRMGSTMIKSGWRSSREQYGSAAISISPLLVASQTSRRSNFGITFDSQLAISQTASTAKGSPM